MGKQKGQRPQAVVPFSCSVLIKDACPLLRLFLFVMLFYFSSQAGVTIEEKRLDVRDLLSRKELYSSKIITIEGYIYVEYERWCLFATKKDFDEKIFENSISLISYVSAAAQKKSTGVNGDLVEITGLYELATTEIGNKLFPNGVLKNITQMKKMNTTFNQGPAEAKPDKK